MFEAAFFCGRWFLCFFAFFTALFSRNSGKGHKSEPRNLVSALTRSAAAVCPVPAVPRVPGSASVVFSNSFQADRRYVVSNAMDVPIELCVSAKYVLPKRPFHVLQQEQAS